MKKIAVYILSLVLTGFSVYYLSGNAGKLSVWQEPKVNVTLVNKGMKSIQLIIPKLMDMQILPSSYSIGSMKVGQKICFNHNGHSHVLLEVDKSMEGQVIELSTLLEETKTAYDFKETMLY